MGFIEEELAAVRSEIRDIPYTELITCYPAMVQVRVSHTPYKQLTVCAQFGKEYPQTALLVELKSRTIPERLLEGMVKVCDQEMQKHQGESQVMVLVRFVCDFISSNPFLVCSEELSFIRRELHREGDELKVRQRAGSIQYHAQQGRYYMDLVLTVPNEYPEKHVALDVKGSNFPQELLQVFGGHSAEMSRQCIEPPLRKKPGDQPFAPKPSLQLIANYLVVECVRRYPLEKCSLCRETALPEDPKNLITDDSHPKYVCRVYCGHLYHQDCLNTYMKTPPFAGGKKCPVCKQRIFHEKWNVPPRLAEERWAHQEARRREIAEVADFLGFK